MMQAIENVKDRGRAKDLKTVVPRCLDMRQAGVYTGLSYWTVRELALRGEFPIIRVGRRIVIDIRDLDAWLESQKTQERIW